MLQEVCRNAVLCDKILGLRRRVYMQAHYTRLFADDQGESRFEDVAIELTQELSVPGADALSIAPFLSSEGTFWVGASPTWKGDAPHPAPRRYIARCRIGYLTRTPTLKWPRRWSSAWRRSASLEQM